ncbi:hypothetical protein [Bacillus gobiensis]
MKVRMLATFYDSEGRREKVTQVGDGSLLSDTLLFWNLHWIVDDGPFSCK